MNPAARLDLIQSLREQTMRLQAVDRTVCDPEAVATGFDALDRLLLGVGLDRGGLVEWLSRGRGSGAGVLALAVAANRLRAGGACVVVDRGDFYPPAAAHAGIPLERMVLVRPSDDREAWWAWEQSLRCSGVAVTLGVVDALDDRAFRRLQLAVETGGGLGFLLRSERWRASPSWASARLWVTALPSRGTLYSPGWRWRVERLPARGRAGATAELEWDGETNPLPLVPSLARSALARRSTSASLSGSGAAHAG